MPFRMEDTGKEFKERRRYSKHGRGIYTPGGLVLKCPKRFQNLALFTTGFSHLRSVFVE